MSAELASGAYEVDCEPIGKVAPGFVDACKAGRANGESQPYRFIVDAAGQWSVAPPLSGGTNGSQALKAIRLEGLECLQAQLVVVCEVPRNTEVFKDASSESPGVRSRSGLVMLAIHVGAIDLKKVETQ